MAQAKITKRFADTAGPGEYRDTELTGFVLLVTKTGHKSYQVRYRLPGNRKGTHTFGRVGTITPEQARQRARELLFEVSQGRDPSAAADAARKAWTVKQLIEEYTTSHFPSLREASRRDYSASFLRFIVPEWGRHKVTEIDAAAAHRLLRKVEGKTRLIENGAIVRTGQTMANRVLAHASSLFSEAIRLGLRADNPCKAVKRNPEHKRERYLSGEETARLMNACDASPYNTAANLVRLLVYTGARRGETLKARWEEIDLERGLWTKAAHVTKSKRVHQVPLRPAAVELLKAMHTANGGKSPWLFPGANPENHLVEPKRPVTAIFKAAGLGQDVTLHTLRHSFAALLVSAGESLHVTGKLLGHSQAATTHRYAHLAHDPQREALARGAAVLDAARAKLAAEDEAQAAKTGPSAEVVNFAEEAARRHSRPK